METLQEKNNKNYNSLISDTFNSIALLIQSFNNQYSCYSKKFNSFYSLPEGAKLIIDSFPDCLISFETHKEDEIKYTYGCGYKDQQITVNKRIVVVFEQSTFILPNNSENIKELARKISGKSLKLTEVSNVEYIEPVKIEQEVFKSVCVFDKETIKQIKIASTFVQKDDLRPNLECVLIDSENIVGTDAHRLFKESHNLDVINEILLPIEAVKFIKSAKTDIIVYKSVNKWRLETGLNIFEYNIPDFTFPNYRMIWPNKNQTTAKINRNDLINALKQNAIYANQASNLVRLSFNNYNLLVSSQDIDYAIAGYQRINYSGDWSGEIGFKSSFLIQCLNVSKEKDVTIKFTDPSRAAIIDNTLLMPMSLTC